jgi:hypothetical protein
MDGVAVDAVQVLENKLRSCLLPARRLDRQRHHDEAPGGCWGCCRQCSFLGAW